MTSPESSTTSEAIEPPELVLSVTLPGHELQSLARTAQRDAIGPLGVDREVEPLACTVVELTEPVPVLITVSTPGVPVAVRVVPASPSGTLLLSSITRLASLPLLKSIVPEESGRPVFDRYEPGDGAAGEVDRASLGVRRVVDGQIGGPLDVHDRDVRVQELDALLGIRPQRHVVDVAGGVVERQRRRRVDRLNHDRVVHVAGIHRDQA